LVRRRKRGYKKLSVKGCRRKATIDNKHPKPSGGRKGGLKRLCFQTGLISGKINRLIKQDK